jgi:murein DD-endopeptidase MepM/ murein hydrolase activator NlpD
MLLHRIAAGFLACALGAPVLVHAQGHAPLGTGFIPAPAELDRTPHAGPWSMRRPPRTDRASAYPLYRWPLDQPLGDDLVVVNYVDHASAGTIRDFMGGAHAYDGHTGTDIALLNFRAMDRGVGILAAASGTVEFVGASAPGAFDRSCTFAWPDDGNWIWIAYGDGTYHEYLHMRAWSMTVAPGESVQPGQLLGLVGSSGYSTAPHLHFETGDYLGGPYQRRDPFTGPFNPLPSLWAAQEDYEGDDPLRFTDMGVFTDAAVGGSVFNTSYCDIQEGIPAPVVFGATEPHIDLWLQFQGNPGDSFRVEVRKPNGEVYASYADALGGDARLDWFWVYWFWNGAISPADYGTWTARAYAGGGWVGATLSRETPFVVGASTVYAPRLRRAGRSFRINGSAQRDTLRVRPLSPAVTYALLNAPSFVTLQDSIVTVAATSTQPTRSAFFQVVATDAAARRDTAWYHVVDMSKPLEPPTADVGDPPASGAQIALAVVPNPARGATAFTFDLASPGRVELAIYDLAGRRVRALADGAREAGRHVARWDGRDASGRLAPPGLYVARLATQRDTRNTRFVVAR